MRKALAFGLVVLAASLLVPVGASADPAHRHYRGKTSDGRGIAFETVVTNVGVRLEGVSLTVDLECDDGTTLTFRGGFGFGEGPPIVDGSVDLDLRGIGDAIILSGHLGARGGSGTVRQVFAGLDEQESPQVCDSGDLAWTVHRVERRSMRSEASNGVTHTLRIADQTRTIRFPAPATPDALATSPRTLRHYRGRLSPQGRIVVEVGRTAEGLELRQVGLEASVTCEDGTTFGFGSFIGFGGGHPLEPGRLDLDDVGVDQGFHVHGSLGPHAGAGTASMVFPALTDDLEAQACRTGELEWTAWRTDAGY